MEHIWFYIFVNLNLFYGYLIDLFKGLFSLIMLLKYYFLLSKMIIIEKYIFSAMLRYNLLSDFLRSSRTGYPVHFHGTDPVPSWNRSKNLNPVLVGTGSRFLELVLEPVSKSVGIESTIGYPSS